MKARYKAILACGLVTLLFALLFSAYGYNATWRLWNIPTMSPHFADLRVITHGAESYSKGFDPMIKNPGDPWQRRLNYPRVWQILYSLGINQTHTTFLGLVIIFSFLCGVCLILPYAGNMTVFLVFAAVLSPASLLGVERANIDLLIFFLASLSVLAAQRSYLLSGLAVSAGFILKLFPIFGWTVLLKAGKSRFMLYTLILLIFVSFYTVATFSDMLLIKEGTPKSASLSYGLNVFWMSVGNVNATLGLCAKVLSCLSVLLIFVFAFSALWRNDCLREDQNGTVSLDAFRVGSAIYIGTFLIGNNWDYRLMFLIFTIPQLVFWTKRAATVSNISKPTAAAIFVSLWYLVIGRLLRHLPYGNHISFILDEMSHWVALSGLAYLLFWSMPAWVKAAAQTIPASRSGLD